MVGKPILITFVAFSIMCCASVKAGARDIRPITVKVVDAKSKDPLEGISVYYAIEVIVSKKYTLFFIKNVEPDLGSKMIYKKRKYTNGDGVVVFSLKDIALAKGGRTGLEERIDLEFLFINLDIDMDSKYAKIIKKAGQSYYASGKVRRKGAFDNVDVMCSAMQDNAKIRKQIFINPNNQYNGKIVISTAGQNVEENKDWTDTKDIFHIHWNENSLSKNKDFITVALEPF